MCNTSALCNAAKGNTCTFSNNQCSCKSGWFSKSACYGGEYGTLWYTSGACSGTPTHFVNKSQESDSRCRETQEDGASAKIERNCQGVADFDAPKTSFFNDTNCTALRSERLDSDWKKLMCKCSLPFFQEDARCSGLVEQASAIQGCLGEQSPNKCNEPCRPLLEQYMRLDCEYHRDVAKMLSACEAQLITNKIVMTMAYTVGSTCPAQVTSVSGHPDWFIAGVADGKCRRVKEPNDGASYVKVTCLDTTSATYESCSSTDCSTDCKIFNITGVTGTCASAAGEGLPPPLEKVKAYAIGCSGTTQSPTSASGNAPTTAFSAGPRISPGLALALVLGLIPFLRL